MVGHPAEKALPAVDGLFLQIEVAGHIGLSGGLRVFEPGGNILVHIVDIEGGEDALNAGLLDIAAHADLCGQLSCDIKHDGPAGEVHGHAIEEGLHLFQREIVEDARAEEDRAVVPVDLIEPAEIVEVGGAYLSSGQRSPSFHK